MITEREVKELTKELEQCDNIQQMFNVLGQTYDLTSCKPSTITKPLFIRGIIQGIKLIQPQKK
jgi:hypothetical protein